MSAQASVKVRCPKCQAKYRLPGKAVGHRVRCGRCKAAFRVPTMPTAEPRRNGIPTDDDILRWLNEGLDEDKLAARPRIISGGDARTAAPTDRLKPAEMHAPTPVDNRSEAPAPTPARLSPPEVIRAAEPDAVLRKTG